MKLIDIIRDANSNLFRSKARTLLTIIAIFIGALTLTITNGIGDGVSKYIDKQLGNLGAEDVIVVQPKMDDAFGTGPKKYDAGQLSSTGGYGIVMPLLQDKDLKEVAAVAGVMSAEPLLSAAPDYVVGPNSEKYQLSVSAFIAGTRLDLVSGRLPDSGSAENELVLPFDFSPALGFASPADAIGKQVTIGISSAARVQREIKATVIGVQEKSLMSLGGANANDTLMRNLVAIQSEGTPATVPKGYMAIIARVASDISDSDMQRVKDDLKAKNYDAQTFQDSIGLFKQAIGAIIAVLNFFAIIALIAASFGIVNTLLMAVQERTKEIGLMKAMGLGGGKIFLLFSIEAILLGFWGSLLGSLAGIGVGQIANRIASNTFLKDLPGFTLTSFSPLSVAVIMLIIMAIAFIAGTVPARRASRKDPIEALRYE
jgi:putative ABC transport system permease protein